MADIESCRDILNLSVPFVVSTQGVKKGDIRYGPKKDFEKST